MAKRKTIDIAVIIPDASPILTLHRVGRLDVLSLIDVPIHLVDQVHYEVTKPANDPDGAIGEVLARMGNSITIVETAVGTGFKAMRAKNPKFRSKNLGEQAVAEHVLRLLDEKKDFVPLVLFEDPGVIEMEMFKNERIHFLTTAAWLQILRRAGILPDGAMIQRQIDNLRKTAMPRVERRGRIRKLVSQWQPKAKP